MGKVVLERTVSRKRKLGYSVGGITSPEVRVIGKRTGFDVIDVASGESSPSKSQRGF